MKRLSTVLLMSVVSASAYADNTCFSQKYDAYIDASLSWYADLTKLTSERNPDLAEVSQWFLEGRQHHFALNRAAVHYYLQHDPSKVATTQHVESWLKLEQPEIKQLATRSDELGKLASVTFADRQATPHPKNYELRSALADLLSHPKQIESALNRYNQAIEKVEAMKCQ
ncbi:hypothetical protein ACNKV7_000460 [Vibrio cholerae]|uniref:hypothetical protein n=1 Tax=Vibrio cholerae TaxID=666 RepID=UPI0015CF4F0C|nr:hypothetical protein [Vibrio cholerae]EGR4116339.1 hypothetical protein [Vibrio cholerae]EGR4214951.1 hypothetical protein [Vibrio cholerae]EIR1598986.1 hypothetical protein [Vibrio cholerae]EJL6572362.1 hypothetical protein [Vibrio cholerae]EJL6601903.1 hypothetical protein [Vibrio cholerae]